MTKKEQKMLSAIIKCAVDMTSLVEVVEAAAEVGALKAKELRDTDGPRAREWDCYAYSLRSIKPPWV